ncbi:MAG TPA: transcriptional repressor [Dehalococcoidia bacterium]|jgi:Fe2+ or Zn2+ uptake regulation protein|nr:transcriptional repressor [Dehalococcoidia bacterium]
MHSQKKLSKQLRRHGYRLTQQRRAILQALAQSHEYLTSADILDRAKALGFDLGLTTVYRTMDALADLGLVKRIHLEDGCHRYALASQGHRHYVVCPDCSRTVEFEGCDLGFLFQQVSQSTGFAIQDHWLELFGRCPQCQGVG